MSTHMSLTTFCVNPAIRHDKGKGNEKMGEITRFLGTARMCVNTLDLFLAMFHVNRPNHQQREDGER
jgi:hypothetical protein